nr:unnamed protein product [Digitaria exilis]
MFKDETSKGAQVKMEAHYNSTAFGKTDAQATYGVRFRRSTWRPKYVPVLRHCLLAFGPCIVIKPIRGREQGVIHDPKLYNSVAGLVFLARSTVHPSVDNLRRRGAVIAGLGTCCSEAGSIYVATPPNPHTFVAICIRLPHHLLHFLLLSLSSILRFNSSKLTRPVAIHVRLPHHLLHFLLNHLLS